MTNQPIGYQPNYHKTAQMITQILQGYPNSVQAESKQARRNSETNVCIVSNTS